MTQAKNGGQICLIISLLATILLTLVAAAALAFYAVSYYSRDNRCEGEECIHIVNNLLDSVDQTADPCTDFYQFSCGRFEKSLLGKNSFSKSSAYFTAAAEEMLNNENIETQHFLKMKTFYSACMNISERESLSSFRDKLKMLGGWPLLQQTWNDTDWLKMTSTMIELGFATNYLLSLQVSRDIFNNSIFRLRIDQPAFGMIQKEYYDDKQKVADYKEFITEVANALCEVNCNGNNSEKTDDINAALQVEIHLAQLSLSLNDYKDEDKVYHPMSLGDLQKQVPKLNWELFIQMNINENVSSDESIVLPSLSVIANITQYLSEMSSTYQGRRTIANYLMYRLAIDWSGDLNRRLNHIYVDHSSAASPYLSDQCVSSTTTAFQISLLSSYQNFYYDDQKRLKIINLVKRLKEELIKILKKTSWLDKETRENAITKIRSIGITVGFPDDFRNDTKVNEWYQELSVGEDHFENVLKANTFYRLKEIELYTSRKIADPKDWLYLPEMYDVNAFYVATKNEIYITMGISSEFFFGIHNPLYSNYGRMGAIIGHELTHSIDQNGAKYDIKGDEKNWWNTDTLLQYQNRSQCLVDIFSDIVDNVTGLHINGNQTLTETTADSVGLREAYSAYLEDIDKNVVEKLPGFPYDIKQLFWISYATSWCSKLTYDDLMESILFDEHPPVNARVNGLFLNNADFAKDFGCALGTPMNPSDQKCYIFGQ